LVLGSLGLIDQGEIDWKILAMEVHEAEAAGVSSIADYDRVYPGAVSDVREWFRTIKTFDGKSENRYLKDGKVFSREDSIGIIRECHEQY
jgi:inorganic pyrophosphatase